MQTLDLPCNPTVDSPAPDPSAMSDDSSPIHSQDDDKAHVESNAGSKSNIDDSNNSVVVVKRERPSRACTQRAAARIAAAAEAEAEMAEKERKRKRAMKEKSTARVLKEESEEEGSFGVEDEGEGEEEEEEEENGREGGGSLSFSNPQCGKIVTQLVGEVEPAQVPRWNIRSMWQLASILNFLNVFRPLLNIKVEFSAEEFETALIAPNNTLGDVHIPLLKAIPPVTRMALGHNTWVTVLCRKLRDWWHWVAEGDLPIVASHGAEVEAYKALNPEVRVVILKALCDIRVEQEDIRNYIDDSMKHGVHLSAFRKERIGGDSHGISYWYEDDPIIGHRLYREIRKVEVNKRKGKSVPPIPHSSYQWEAVATNFDEFLNVSDKLFSSKNRIEVSVGKKLKNGMLPEIEKVHKRKEKQLKKQHRQALMLDNMISMDGLGVGRSLRDRKPVTYTFDDFDRSINEAIKVTKKKQPSPEPFERREPPLVKIEDSSNGRWDGGGPSQYPPHDSTFSAVSPNSFENDDNDDDEYRHYDDREDETLDRSGRRRRKKPKQYSVNEFVEPLSENDPDFESDEDIVGEVVYDDDYLRKKNNKGRKTSSSSESEEEYRLEEENPEEEEEEEDEEEDNDTSNTDEDSDNPNPRKFKSIQGRGNTRRGTRLRSVDELQSGLRRSKRSTRNRINYQQYEMSESEPELPRPEKSNALEEHYSTSDNEDEDNELTMGSQDFEENVVTEEVMAAGNGHAEEDLENNVVDDEKQVGPREEESKGLDQEESSDGGVREKRRFLDLNELALGSGFDDGPALNRDGDDDEY